MGRMEPIYLCWGGSGMEGLRRKQGWTGDLSGCRSDRNAVNTHTSSPICELSSLNLISSGCYFLSLQENGKFRLAFVFFFQLAEYM